MGKSAGHQFDGTRMSRAISLFPAEELTASPFVCRPSRVCWDVRRPRRCFICIVVIGVSSVASGRG